MFTPLALEIPNYGRWPITSFEEASGIYCGVRENTGLGASGFPAGEVLADDVPIARVSYNGRVWKPGPWSIGDQPLCEASPAINGMMMEAA
jgi:hypothetical protein